MIRESPSYIRIGISIGRCVTGLLHDNRPVLYGDAYDMAEVLAQRSLPNRILASNDYISSLGIQLETEDVDNDLPNQPDSRSSSRPRSSVYGLSRTSSTRSLNKANKAGSLMDVCGKMSWLSSCIA